jgi:hypothetical protein
VVAHGVRVIVSSYYRATSDAVTVPSALETRGPGTTRIGSMRVDVLSR